MLVLLSQSLLSTNRENKSFLVLFFKKELLACLPSHHHSKCLIFAHSTSLGRVSPRHRTICNPASCGIT